ncbi:hypothetical protein [Pseudomarimonas arenosa]|uniref:Uncharacterized protein n=1 Tax=Pseudomarimonas arenosa TaxID=2774145 RepID=A0AAW3ZQ88_9GAMM|nr:hypothetical protein [Pseudomarimonas arenosa]MBD8526799.1 hypothetical protein [Pseudomarimonas arenosa]
MKKSVLFSALVAIALSPAAFAGNDNLTVDELVNITGMKRDAVLLMVGPKSNNILYRTANIRTERQWEAAVEKHGLLVQRVRDVTGQETLVVRRVSDEQADDQA